ncbi:hypothetical protein FA13DRAFT_1774101 [Coprinellus micaceus]|uniref:Uncharacterized protein n=1 Tax=Coprinellus micaceus TaxID=71717 RepID=A0A4Y7TDC8_COPMI|nr:hypothetical protein FA13DRAFT_1774101 [Coprinellus micaceus]
MARVDPSYSPSSSAHTSPASQGTSSSLFRPSSPSPGWRLGACLPDHLSQFAESTVKQDPPLFHPIFQNPHCLFNEQRPSPLPPGCKTCYRVLKGQATPEETRTWRTARERWRKQKEDGWKELRQRREDTVLTIVELEMLRARRVVAATLGLTNEEIRKWESKGERKWRERARAEAYVRDESLRDGFVNSEPVPDA